jgi:cytochrome P450
MTARFPPGPPALKVLRELRSEPSRRIYAIQELHRTYGDSVHTRFLDRHFYVFSHPDQIRTILVEGADKFHATPGFRRDSSRVLDPVKVSQQQVDHRRLRRIIQPALMPTRLAPYADMMTTFTADYLQQRRDGDIRDFSEDLAQLTLRIAGQSLFGVDVTTRLDGISEALRIAQEYLSGMNRRVRLPLWVPAPKHITLWKAWDNLTKTVREMIRQRRASGEPGHDMLGAILAAVDETDGSTLTESEAQGQIIGLLIAGHETTATALTWTFFLLAGHPEVEAALHDELDRALNGSTPTFADLERLPLVEAIIRESMRLYPPAWILTRRALKGAQVGEWALPEGSTVLFSPYVVQRDERFYDRPTQFEPQRWANGLEKRLPRYAYFPFGGGSHVCTGQHFAWLETQLLLATISQQWRLSRADDAPVGLLPMITLRPDKPIMMRFECRT